MRFSLLLLCIFALILNSYCVLASTSSSSLMKPLHQHNITVNEKTTSNLQQQQQQRRFVVLSSTTEKEEEEERSNKAPLTLSKSTTTDPLFALVIFVALSSLMF